MKLGIIARSENRGLGIQTHEACLHLNPERVLLVQPQPARWPVHRDWYEGHFDTTRVRWDGRTLHEDKVRRWLSGLDVVYTAETPYDERLPQWARDAGCAVVVHANPEQLAARSAQNRFVTWWAPTRWRVENLPFGTKVVPMPVAVERFTRRQHDPSGPVTFVHSAGHEAAWDRNGTRLFVDAVRQLEVDCRVRIFGQDGSLPKVRLRQGLPHEVDLEMSPGGVQDYWDQYIGGDVLVMPRRYGGLCLPVQEALAAGLVVVMTDTSPNEMWPGPKVPPAGFQQVRVRCGEVPIYNADPSDLAAVMEKLVWDRDWLVALQAEARAWAEAHSWEALLPTWEKQLHRAIHR